MSDRLMAIRLVVILMKSTKMSLFDAVRASAHHYQVSADWLYREMTSE